MATMKDFLRSSIMAGGSVAAAPSGQTVSISAKSSVGDWAEICNFVSPNNGYVQVKGISTELGAVSTILVDSGFAGASWSGSDLDLGYCLPVKRGDTVNVSGSYLKNVTVVLRVLGGAKIPVAQLFWRVVPCLRNCLTRALTRTLKAKRTGSGSNLFRLPQPSNINGHRAIGMKSFLLKRGGFPFELTEDYPAFSVSTVSGHSGYFGASVPVRKGIPISFKITGDVPTSDVYIRFHRIKGGT